jgi:hypothetical protein
VPSDTVTLDARLPLERASWRRGAGVLLLFLALTAFFTWPQVTMMRHGLVAHQDPLFSAWRLGWVSHALFTDPGNLFEGNILYPAHRTLAFSDAMLLQGLIAAPFIRLGVSPLLMVNVLWFVSMIASAGGMYLLARRLTGSTLGAIIAAVIFTFAPYRTEHNMHLELNWAQWIPLTLWSLHRALSEDRFADGLLAGVFVVLQLLSCIYYAMYLLLLLPLFGLGGLMLYRGKYSWRPLAGFVVGGAILVAVAIPYSAPYRANVHTVGTRAEFEIASWSATAGSFVATTPENLLYGRLTEEFGGSEARDFPGVIAIVLLVIALLPPYNNPTRLLYLLGLAFAVEACLGMNGWLYPLLLRYVTSLNGLRAPGRMGIFVLATLGVLAAYGVARVQGWLRSARLRLAVPVVACALLGVEYMTTPLVIWRLPTKPPSIYEWVSKLPHPTLIAEFPMLHADPFYMYFSTMHWQPMLNGYSGFRPSSYIEMVARFEKSFPDDRTMDELRRRGVRTIIVHKELFRDDPDHKAYARTIQALAFRTDVEFVATWRDHVGEARAYMLPAAPPSSALTSQAR